MKDKSLKLLEEQNRKETNIKDEFDSDDCPEEEDDWCDDPEEEDDDENLAITNVNSSIVNFKEYSEVY